MTRSNDPFEDLPEWKERRRLHEIERLRQGGAPARDGYAEGAADYGTPHSGAPHLGAHHLGAPGGYDAAPGHDGSGVPAWHEPAAPAYDGAHGQPAPGYGDYDPRAYARQHAGHHPGQEPALYPDEPGGFASARAVYPAGSDFAPAGDVAPGGEWARTPHTGHPPPALGERHGDPGAPDFGVADYAAAGGYQPPLRGGQFDDGTFAYPVPAGAEPSLGDYRAGAPQDYGALPPLYGDEGLGAGRPEDRRLHEGQAAEDDEYDDEYDDYEYEDEEDEEGRGYSWKLLAVVVAAGVVIAGGGVAVYGMLAGGGGGGPAPIIKAEQGPAKTAPSDPGGRTFANQDSKLLGRLDNGPGETRSAALDADGRSRVREVPTVRVAPDGRLILPSEPQSVPAGTGDEGAVAAPRVPGINIVDSLSGGRNGGLGILPPVIPKSETAPQRTAAAPVQPAIVNGAGATSQPSSPEAPIIRNSGASRSANLATAPGGAPPVPQKSAISTGWRMTGAPQASARAEPAAPATSATTTASTLGASSIVQGEARSYVAVVATRASRMEALESFAELQQRHPQALSNRVPDVQEADLRSRGLGMMYRLLVGPAGSRQAANEVCASLKAGGYNGCWVKAN